MMMIENQKIPKICFKDLTIRLYGEDFLRIAY
jgi:hypothetical protein